MVTSARHIRLTTSKSAIEIWINRRRGARSRDMQGSCARGAHVASGLPPALPPAICTSIVHRHKHDACFAAPSPELQRLTAPMLSRAELAAAGRRKVGGAAIPAA